MIVDTSAIVAIVLAEPEQRRFQTAMADAPMRRMSAGNWIELSAVVVRRKIMSAVWLDRAIDEFELTIEPVTAAQADIAHQAYCRYGIGSGHPAKLNFGDCFAYALAKAISEPLLFKGNDFRQTDIVSAL